MTFPFVSRRRYEVELAVLDEQAVALAKVNAELRQDREYWKVRCERLLDAALLKKGETHEPVMSNPPSTKTETLRNPFGWMQNLSRTELTGNSG